MRQSTISERLEEEEEEEEEAAAKVWKKNVTFVSKKYLYTFDDMLHYII